MDVKIKCTQCGSDDLKETGFPYEVNLVMTECGIAGESSFYALDKKALTKTYICTQCGHFEFFSKELANSIKNK